MVKSSPAGFSFNRQISTGSNRCFSKGIMGIMNLVQVLVMEEQVDCMEGEAIVAVVDIIPIQDRMKFDAVA